MKNCHIVSVILALLATSAQAKHISTKYAETAAVNYMEMLGTGQTYTVKKIVAEKDSASNTDLLIWVEFDQGGWVLLSADDNTQPVLGHSPDGELPKPNDRPPAMQFLLDSYKQQIKYAKKHHVQCPQNREKWEKLQIKESLKLKSAPAGLETGNTEKDRLNAFNYTPGNRLLNTPTDGEVEWGQSGCNNVATCNLCNHLYNMYIESCTSGDNCYCSHRAAGCGVVAMAQILWYWRFPAAVGAYVDWRLMPNQLDANAGFPEANEIAALMQNLGVLTDMNYWSGGSWTTLTNLGDAFAGLGYADARIEGRSAYSDNAWVQLMKNEINAGRPVLYYGEKALLNFTYKHYWVVDGYNNNDEFHINWGWMGLNNIWFYLNNLMPDQQYPDEEYNSRNKAIVGIEPDCGFLPSTISTTPSPWVTSRMHLMASSQVALPGTYSGYNSAFDNTLTLTSSANMIITAKSVRLYPGFRIDLGASLRIDLRECGSTRHGNTSILKSSPMDGNGYIHNLDQRAAYNQSQSNDVDIALYPNPNRGSFTIGCSKKESMEKIEVFGLNGKLAKCSFVWQGFNKASCWLVKPEKGIYIVKIHFFDEIQVVKMVVI